MIEFLQDYTTEALPPERFTQGAQVSRSEESERYFVGRGLAGYVIDGKLVDADRRPIVTAPIVEVVQPANLRSDLTARAGEIMTGQPPRATSGPGVPFVEPAAGIAGSPPVVLEAEVERLKAALATSNDLFRDMNNSHVADKDGLRAENDRLKTELSAAQAQRGSAVAALTEAQTGYESLQVEYKAAREQLDVATPRIAELERQLEDATKPPATEDGGTAKPGKTK